MAAGDRLLWLVAQGIAPIRRAAPGGGVQNESALEARGRRAITYLDSMPRQWTSIMRELHETTRRTTDWEQLFATLQNDPDAVIPTE